MLAVLGCRQDVPDGHEVDQEVSALRPFPEGLTLSLEEPFTVVFKGPVPRLGSFASGLNLSVWSTLFLSHEETRPQRGVGVTRAACRLYPQEGLARLSLLLPPGGGLQTACGNLWASLTFYIEFVCVEGFLC